jgi:predicted hydrocarbon binding protein
MLEMENVFMNKKNHDTFSWKNLGEVKEGRGSLGEEMPVLVYRLMQFTMRDVLVKDFGREKADHYLREAGRLAGMEFTKNALNTDLDFDNFVAGLQKSLLDLKIGILRVETVSDDAGKITLTVGEDLDCSGLPITDEAVCCYDEGFIAGILAVYTGKQYSVREIDCWANGDRTCRFNCTIMD